MQSQERLSLEKVLTSSSLKSRCLNNSQSPYFTKDNERQWNIRIKDFVFQPFKSSTAFSGLRSVQIKSCNYNLKP